MYTYTGHVFVYVHTQPIRISPSFNIIVRSPRRDIFMHDIILSKILKDDKLETVQPGFFIRRSSYKYHIVSGISGNVDVRSAERHVTAGIGDHKCHGSKVNNFSKLAFWLHCRTMKDNE